MGKKMFFAPWSCILQGRTVEYSDESYAARDIREVAIFHEIITYNVKSLLKDFAEFEKNEIVRL